MKRGPGIQLWGTLIFRVRPEEGIGFTEKAERQQKNLWSEVSFSPEKRVYKEGSGHIMDEMQLRHQTKCGSKSTLRFSDVLVIRSLVLTALGKWYAETKIVWVEKRVTSKEMWKERRKFQWNLSLEVKWCLRKVYFLIFDFMFLRWKRLQFV